MLKVRQLTGRHAVVMRRASGSASENWARMRLVIDDIRNNGHRQANTNPLVAPNTSAKCVEFSAFRRARSHSIRIGCVGVCFCCCSL